MSLKEIKTIREKVPDVEIEVFIHGAMCMAYSGRCLLSNYFTNRDANRGICAQDCRWNYKVIAEGMRKLELMILWKMKKEHTCLMLRTCVR